MAEWYKKIMQQKEKWMDKRKEEKMDETKLGEIWDGKSK